MSQIENPSIQEKKSLQKEIEAAKESSGLKHISTLQIEMPKAKLKKKRRRLPAW